MSALQDTVKEAAQELPGLDAMLAAMEEGPEIFKASRFWEHHAARNLEQLVDEGFGAFKRTVNRSYFQWEPGSPRGEGPRERVARQLLRAWLRRPTPRVLTARLSHPERSLHASSAPRWHALFVAVLWEQARRRDPRGVLDQLEEPELGEAPSVRYRGRSISEDIAHSTLELATLDEAGAVPGPGSLVIELGGGYGRLAWLLLRTLPGVRYVMCDIPPALAIAQRYLTELFPTRPALRFRDFQSPEAVAEELSRAELVFLLPHQLAMLPPLGADLFINISSLHEMRHDQIASWFGLIDRHTTGCFYTKQWLHSVNVFDELVVERREYPVPAHWEALLDREIQTPPDFFEAVYRLHASPSPA